MIYVGELMKRLDIFPVARYYGKYGDIVYLYTEDRELYYCTLPKIEISMKSYQELLARLNVPNEERYLDKITVSTIKLFNEHERKREFLLFVNLHQQVIVTLLEKKILYKHIKERIIKHIDDIRKGK